MVCSFEDVESCELGVGLVDVGLVLGLPLRILHCSAGGLGSLAHWGLHILGSMPRRGALGTLVNGGGVGESWASLGSLALPVGFSNGGPQCRALCLWAFLSYSFAGALALWPLNR